MFIKGELPAKHKEDCKCFRCSRIPWNKGKKGLIPWNKNKHTGNFGNGFQKGLTPWNKGKEFSQISGEKHYNWQGGKRKDSYGYVLIYMPQHPFCNKARYVPEHRLIVEKQISRYLKSTEEVHHLNEIKDDNKLQNLMAFINDKAHKRFEHNPDNVKPEEIIFDGRKLH